MSYQPTYDDELIEIKKLDKHVVPVIAEPPPHVPLRSVKDTTIKRGWEGEHGRPRWDDPGTTTPVRPEVWLLVAGIVVWVGIELSFR